MSYPDAPSFRSAGYTNLETNSSYVGGLVRQHGNVSFSRVFEAGHAVAAYQTETVYQIFNRAIFGRDIATGDIVIGAEGNYSSVGPASSFSVKNELPLSPGSICYLYEAPLTCTEEQGEALMNGTAVVENFIVIKPPGNPPTSTTSTGSGGNDTSATGTGSSSTPSGTQHTNGGLKGGNPSLGIAFAASVLLSSVWLLGLV